MDAPQITLEQDYLTADVGPDMTIADLKGYIESETNIPGASQRVFHQERELANDSMTLQQCQVGNDSMLGMLVRNSQHSSLGSSRHVQGQRGAQAQAGARSGAQSQNVVNDPEIIRLQAMGDPNILARIRATNPELADAVQDPVRFRQVMQELERQRNEMEIERQRRQDLLAADPFNVDAQREIEEMIREQQVMENMQNAMEHNPEVFARVHMLYIPVEVNNYNVKAFVDSGAQTTIMSPACAENCGIFRLLDKRFAGIARGVGTAKILGRVHSAIIKIGAAYLPCSFTVMEGKDVDLLLGLDMLKKHQACIDLQKGKLIIQGNEVEFLGEADIPRSEEVYREEPTIEGPAGTRTGAISGSVTQAGAPDPSNTRASRGESSISGGGGSGSGSGPHSQSTTGPASFPKEDIERLTNLGFSRREAIHALEMAGGNVEMAAGLLL